MGYCSDVSVLFYTRNIDALPFGTLKFWFDENYPRKDATEYWGAEIETGHHWVMVTYKDVKWYEDFDHVKAVRACLDSFVECLEGDIDSPNAAYEMVEVGEQVDDIRETRSDYCDYLLGVRREIVME
jgi:hypothetical protein